MWNTGISTVYNNTGVELNWNDLETDNDFFGSRAGQIPGGHNGKLAVVAPWCNNSYDVATKAIQFSTDPGGAQFYVFQDEGDGLLYYVSASEIGSAIWDNRKRCGDGRSSYANLSIGENGEGFFVSATAVGR
jgi:hypothetical protein